MFLRFATVIAVVFLVTAGRLAPLAEGIVPRLERQVGVFMDEARLPGLALALIDGGDLVYARGFGLADRSSGRSVERDTLFQIGSTTKALTATLAVMLRDEGRLQLEDTLARRLPAEMLPVQPAAAGITLLQLATHSSGLPRQPPTLRRPHGDYPVLAFTHFELGRSLEGAQLEGQPGKQFAYSNFGYAVLGHVLERASGDPYETLLRERLFEPLRMESSTITLWPHLAPRLARPYYRTDDDTLEEYTPWDTEALAPAGGVASTVDDLARLLQAYLADGDDGPLSLAVRDEVLTPRVDLGDGRAYALGWMIEETAGGGRIVYHGGDVDGYTAYLAFHPGQRAGVVVLTNTGDAPVDRLGRWALLQLVRRPPQVEP